MRVSTMNNERIRLQRNLQADFISGPKKPKRNNPYLWNMKWLSALIGLVWSFVKLVVVVSGTAVLLTANFLIKVIEGIMHVIRAIILLLLLLAMAAGICWLVYSLLC